AVSRTLCRVMRGRKGIYLYISNCKVCAAVKGSQMVICLRKFTRKCFSRSDCGVKWNAVTLDERCHTFNMIDVLMGQQHGIQIVNRQPQSCQQCGQATHGHTEVNQYVSAVERKQSA